MTSKQRIAILADWWPRACEAQNWRKDDREKRLAVVSQAVGREITSFNDLNNSSDIDRVKAHLGFLCDNVKATIETLPAPQVELSAGQGSQFKTDTAGYRRRLFWLIRQHGRALSPTAPEHYILSIAADRFHLVAGLRTLEDLTTPQLHQLMITLNARRHKKQSALSDQSYLSEETFPDQVEFQEAQEPELVSGPF
jgi:hypothetical protein